MLVGLVSTARAQATPYQQMDTEARIADVQYRTGGRRVRVQRTEIKVQEPRERAKPTAPDPVRRAAAEERQAAKAARREESLGRAKRTLQSAQERAEAARKRRDELRAGLL